LKIKNLHIELTETCNAACPQCARNNCGGPTSPLIENLEITLNQFKKYVPKTLLKNSIEKISIGGNYGDPSLARDLIPILKYIKETNENILLSVETNGGTKNTKWFSELGTILNSEQCYCSFSIDGLKDTNHIYRKNVKWSKVIENLKAFLESGGMARWNYIVFQHNEHQVNKAKIFASSLGVQDFRIKKTARMNSTMTGPPAIMSYNTEGKLQAIISPPKSHLYRHDKFGERPHLSLDEVMETQVDFDNIQYTNLKKKEVNNIEIAQVDCKSIKNESLYISASGHLFPCCFIAWPLKSNKNSFEEIQIKEMLKKNDLLEDLSLNKSSIEKIISSEGFRYIAQSWQKSDVEEGKLAICSLTCGDCDKGAALSFQTR
jgi:MoaA/NifB/PqqE/SkfB family radical SAM enzyme